MSKRYAVAVVTILMMAATAGHTHAYDRTEHPDSFRVVKDTTYSLGEWFGTELKITQYKKTAMKVTDTYTALLGELQPTFCDSTCGEECICKEPGECCCPPPMTDDSHYYEIPYESVAQQRSDLTSTMNASIRGEVAKAPVTLGGGLETGSESKDTAGTTLTTGSTIPLGCNSHAPTGWKWGISGKATLVITVQQWEIKEGGWLASEGTTYESKAEEDSTEPVIPPVVGVSVHNPPPKKTRCKCKAGVATGPRTIDPDPDPGPADPGSLRTDRGEPGSGAGGTGQGTSDTSYWPGVIDGVDFRLLNDVYTVETAPGETIALGKKGDLVSQVYEVQGDQIYQLKAGENGEFETKDDERVSGWIVEYAGPLAGLVLGLVPTGSRRSEPAVIYSRVAEDTFVPNGLLRVPMEAGQHLGEIDAGIRAGSTSATGIPVARIGNEAVLLLSELPGWFLEAPDKRRWHVGAGGEIVEDGPVRTPAVLGMELSQNTAAPGEPVEAYVRTADAEGQTVRLSDASAGDASFEWNRSLKKVDSNAYEGKVGPDGRVAAGTSRGGRGAHQVSVRAEFGASSSTSESATAVGRGVSSTLNAYQQFYGPNRGRRMWQIHQMKGMGGGGRQ